MLHETTRNNDFLRNTAVQHCFNMVRNGYNTVSTWIGMVITIVSTWIGMVTTLFQHGLEWLQHCFNMVWNGYNIVSTEQHSDPLKIVVANRPV